MPLHQRTSIPGSPMNSAKGFSLLELCITVAIIAMLAALSTIAYSKWIRSASDAVSMKNMKNIGVGLGTYLTSNANWPQVPETLSNDDEEGYWEWWLKALEPYGIDENAWHTNWDEKERKANMKGQGQPIKMPKYWSSYVPTEFDEGYDTPFKWRTQPWLWERSDFSGKGPNCLFPDQSIGKLKMPPTSPPRKK